MKQIINVNLASNTNVYCVKTPGDGTVVGIDIYNDQTADLVYEGTDEDLINTVIFAYKWMYKPSVDLGMLNRIAHGPGVTYYEVPSQYIQNGYPRRYSFLYGTEQAWSQLGNQYIEYGGQNHYIRDMLPYRVTERNVNNRRHFGLFDIHIAQDIVDLANMMGLSTEFEQVINPRDNPLHFKDTIRRLPDYS